MYHLLINHDGENHAKLHIIRRHMILPLIVIGKGAGQIDSISEL